MIELSAAARRRVIQSPTVVTNTVERDLVRVERVEVPAEADPPDLTPLVAALMREIKVLRSIVEQTQAKLDKPIVTTFEHQRDGKDLLRRTVATSKRQG